MDTATATAPTAAIHHGGLSRVVSRPPTTRVGSAVTTLRADVSAWPWFTLLRPFCHRPVTEQCQPGANSREVSLIADQSDRDRYGRLLRYVWIDDVFVNAVLVADGLALARAYPPDEAMVEVLSAAESTARDAGRGLWAPDACGPAAPSALRITHIEADAPGNDNDNLNGEWVEIHNAGTEAADLTGWVLKDESASHRYHFPDGFPIDAGAVVIVFTGCGNDTSDELYWCERGSAVWNNSGDTAFLLDPSGNTVHHRSY